MRLARPRSLPLLVRFILVRLGLGWIAFKFEAREDHE